MVLLHFSPDALLEHLSGGGAAQDGGAVGVNVIIRQSISSEAKTLSTRGGSDAPNGPVLEVFIEDYLAPLVPLLARPNQGFKLNEVVK